MEDENGCVVLLLTLAGGEPWQEVEIPRAALARGARCLEDRVRVERAPRLDMARDQLVPRGGELERDVGAAVVEQTLADGEVLDDVDPESLELGPRPDPAAHEDRRREVRARGENDETRVEAVSFRGRHAGRPRAVEEYTVDERVAHDRQVRPWARILEVCEGGAPATAMVDVLRGRGGADRTRRIARICQALEARSLGRG